MSAAILAAIRLSRESADAERLDIRALQVVGSVVMHTLETLAQHKHDERVISVGVFLYTHVLHLS
jgi:hypothetical protein